MNTQPKTSRQSKISFTLLQVLKSWNLGRLCPQNPIPSPRKCIMAQRSLEASSPQKKSKMRNPSPIQTKKLFGARFSLRAHFMPTSIEILANLSSQLHQCLEGKAIPIGNIPNPNIPLKYFSSGTIAHSLGKAIKNHLPLIPHFHQGYTMFVHPS